MLINLKESKMSYINLMWNSAEIEVQYDLDPGQIGSVDSRGFKYEPDMDESVEIDSIFYNNMEISELFSSDDIQKLEEMILEALDKKARDI
jgi:hypothetical protein